jgi:hypothetical protein
MPISFRLAVVCDRDLRLGAFPLGAVMLSIEWPHAEGHVPDGEEADREGRGHVEGHAKPNCTCDRMTGSNGVCA